MVTIEINITMEQLPKITMEQLPTDNYKPEEDSTSEAVTAATNTMEAATTALEESAPETSTTWDGMNLFLKRTSNQPKI